MKKTIVVALAIVLAVASLSYAVPKSNVGCGFGTLLFQGNDGLASQVCAATTNGSLGSQTFGISSGTLECSKPARFWAKQVDTFVAENMDNLATDIAAGTGETLDSLSDIMDVPSEKRASLYTSLQSQFDTIFPSAQVTHEHVSTQIMMIVEQI